MITPRSLCSPFSFGNNPGGLKRWLPTGLWVRLESKACLSTTLKMSVRENGRALELAPKLRGEVDTVHEKLGGCRKEAQVNYP